jgi:uncharacterized phage protein gp47/JayE
MPFARRTLTQLRDGALQDVAAADIYDTTTGQVVNPILLQFDPLTILAIVLAGLAYEEYGYLDYISLQSTPVTATDEAALEWGALKGKTLEPATAATAVAMFTGPAEADIPIGTPLTRTDGTAYVTTADAVIAAGATTVNIPFEAVNTGASGTIAAGAALTMSNPIPGVAVGVLVVSSTTPGTDIETFDAFKARYLFAFANPPAGGSLTDYEQWALDIPGITRAWTYGQGVGAGSVLLFVMLDNSEVANGGFPVGNNGVATAETRAIATATGDQLTVANAIYPLRPVTALLYVSGPIPQTITFNFSGLGVNNTAANQATALAALQALFLAIGTPLGQTIQPSEWDGALGSALGGIPFTLTAPIGDITVPLGSLPQVTSASVNFIS